MAAITHIPGATFPQPQLGKGTAITGGESPRDSHDLKPSTESIKKVGAMSVELSQSVNDKRPKETKPNYPTYHVLVKTNFDGRRERVEESNGRTERTVIQDNLAKKGMQRALLSAYAKVDLLLDSIR